MHTILILNLCNLFILWMDVLWLVYNKQRSKQEKRWVSRHGTESKEFAFWTMMKLEVSPYISIHYTWHDKQENVAETGRDQPWPHNRQRNLDYSAWQCLANRAIATNYYNADRWWLVNADRERVQVYRWQSIGNSTKLLGNQYYKEYTLYKQKEAWNIRFIIQSF